MTILPLNEDSLLDALGNKTRRMILQTLAEEPKYALQLSKELDVTQPAIQKHLKLLEQTELIQSYEEESNLGAPPRRYYRIRTGVYLTLGLTQTFLEIRAMPIERVDVAAMSLETTHIRQATERLAEVTDPTAKLRESHALLNRIEREIRQIDEVKVALLNIKQEIRKIASDTVQTVTKNGLERKILYTILNSERTPDAELISVTLDVRERTVEDFLREMRKKGVLTR